MNGFLHIPKTLFLDHGLTLTEAAVIADLIGYQKKYEVVTASNEVLARNLPMSSRTVQRCLTSLEEKGAVKTDYAHSKRALKVSSRIEKAFSASVKKERDQARRKNAGVDWLDDYLSKKEET